MTSNWNQLYAKIVKRAEKNDDLDSLSRSFHDAGFVDPLATVEDAIVFGRRGAGKSHLMRHLGHSKLANQGLVIQADMRTVGSSYSGYDTGGDSAQRATRLLRDFLQVIHQQLYDYLIDDTEVGERSVQYLDEFLDSANNLSIEGLPVVFESEYDEYVANKSGVQIDASIRGNLGVQAAAHGGKQTANRQLFRTEEAPRLRISFDGIRSSLARVLQELGVKRLWLLIDEWTSISPELQPYLGDMIRRTLQATPGVTIKIFAVEQRSNFYKQVRDESGSVRSIGIELSADIATTVNLDETMAFDSGREKSQSFFRELLWRHVSEGLRDVGVSCQGSVEMVNQSFKDTRAFKELVRACEGVPRDFLAMLQKASMEAGHEKISVANVRNAARIFYQQDKSRNIDAGSDLEYFMDWIIREVIGDRKSSAFMVPSRDVSDEILQKAYDARLIHLVKRSYSSRHEPGVRYSVFNVDYGAYVDFFQTSAEPRQLTFDELYEGETCMRKSDESEVPEQDLRSVRNCILRLDEFRTSELR